MKQVKIICATPKGKAQKALKSFGRYFSLKKPKEAKVTKPTEFYLLYECKTDKEVKKLIKKCPKAEFTIRQFYTILLSLMGRANKLSKRGAWKLEKTKRWIMKQLGKKVRNPKEYADFIDGVDISDEDYMRKFLLKELVKYEVIESEKEN